MMQIVGFGHAVAVLVLVLAVGVFPPHVVSPQPTFMDSRCDQASGRYTATGTYKHRLDLVLSELTNKALVSMMGYSQSDNLKNNAYGLFYCRGDLNSTICSSCVQSASKLILSKCRGQKDAVIWYGECTLRYFSNNSSSHLMEDGNWSVQGLTNASGSIPFLLKLSRAISPLINRAAYGGQLPGFATGEVNTSSGANTLYYCLAQCSPFTTGDHCSRCLNGALDSILCCSNGSTQLMIFNPSCQLRYAALPFYRLGSVSQQAPVPAGMNAHSPPAGKNAAYYFIRVGPPVVILVLLLAVILCWLFQDVHCLKYKQQKRVEGGTRYSFRTMQKATKNFSEDNELGKGGFGTVYMGKLKNEKIVAIKRLVPGSRQGEEEFSRELTLLGFQHINLVKLLGYCDEKKERMLVYEYAPNSSLDRRLFDRPRSESFPWNDRVKVARGVAKGLEYLHGAARTNQLVHRDIKASNILLEEDMSPKIGDFGLAKEIEQDQTHAITTRVAGTRGYMAPEYIQSGEYSPGSDVFSFGVLLLEIVSGVTNGFGNEENLVSRAWKLWPGPQRRVTQIIDPELDRDSDEIRRYIQIALLCLQFERSDRPSMADVHTYLFNRTVPVPQPTLPNTTPLTHG